MHVSSKVLASLLLLPSGDKASNLQIKLYWLLRLQVESVYLYWDLHYEYWDSRGHKHSLTKLAIATLRSKKKCSETNNFTMMTSFVS